MRVAMQRHAHPISEFSKRDGNSRRSCLRNELRRGGFLVSQDRAYEFAGVQIPEKIPDCAGDYPQRVPVPSGIDPRESPEGSGIFRGSHRLSALDLGIESKTDFKATAAESWKTDPMIWRCLWKRRWQATTRGIAETRAGNSLLIRCYFPHRFRFPSIHRGFRIRRKIRCFFRC